MNVSGFYGQKRQICCKLSFLPAFYNLADVIELMLYISIYLCKIAKAIYYLLQTFTHSQREEENQALILGTYTVFFQRLRNLARKLADSLDLNYFDSRIYSKDHILYTNFYDAHFYTH